MGQLASARAKLAEMGGGAEEAKVRLGHLQKELKEKEPRAKKAQSEDGGLMKEMTSAKADLAKLESQVGSMDQDNSQYEELRTKREAQIQTVKKLSDKRDSLRSGLTRLNFDYTNPSSNFDRNSVKGLVANLIAIEEANFVNSTALEICAGGRLYNVVVDNENVGSQLLAKGRLQQRVTIIPLTKINAFVAAADVRISCHLTDELTQHAETHRGDSYIERQSKVGALSSWLCKRGGSCHEVCLWQHFDLRHDRNGKSRHIRQERQNEVSDSTRGCVRSVRHIDRW